MNPSNDDSDWRPTASLEVLKQRASLLSTMRSTFDSAGYWEVETPVLSHDIVVDAHLDPFTTQFYAGRLPANSSSRGGELFLQTSPEFAMKRVLAAGADAIYQIGRVMRNGEQGSLHNPEFTLAEWYRTGDDHHAQMDFTEHLVRQVFAQAAIFRPEAALPSEPFERMTYNQAFERYAGCEILEMETPEFAALAEIHDLMPPQSLQATDRDGWLNFLLASVVEPELGLDRPAFVFDYPASQASLARVRPENPPVAERFELYLGGIEICNGYHELTDPEVLETRMRRQNLLRQGENARSLPETTRLLAAMRAGLPPCAGVALGVDRLIMRALGLTSIDQVMAFPFPRA